MMKSLVDPNSLHLLHVVLQERSVSRAAKRLHVTAPAVSNTLRRLREELHDPLLVRRGRGLVPTPFALSIAPRLARGFEALESALQADDVDPATTTRTFSLAAEDSQVLTRLGTLVTRLRERMPRANLRVVSVDALIASGGLAGTTVDVVVGPPADERDVHHERLYDEGAVFVARAGHPRVRRQLGKRAFCAEGHVDVHLAMGKGGRGHESAERALAQLGLSRRVVVTVPSFSAAVWVASETDLVAGVPRTLALALQHRLGVTLLRGPLPAFTMPIAMSWHLRTHDDPCAKAFREVVRSAY